ncbi:hypothetical protein [Verrucomicrobium sp. GAS474]|uniref:hypothetical protein n=1 Tax=Verrucomicrobium sp. GAS474 TaxID=1882831 RepID=UPI000B81E18B|nr:hypothetical protein [Verrucomicrobium sp. GAS474]
MLLLLSLGGCAGGGSAAEGQVLAAATARADADGVPQPLRARYIDLLSSGEKDYVVNAMRLGLDAVRIGEHAFAARVFDSAIRREQSLQAGSEQAERAQSKFVGDEEKWFKGEPYERASLYLYRGLLYLETGDVGNAAACAKRVQIEDLSSKEESQGDWYSGEWLLALASLLQADPGTAKDALARAANFFSKQGPVPPPDPQWNVIVIAEAGDAPIKMRQGEYGDELAIREGSCRTIRVTVSTGEGNPPPLSIGTFAAESLYHQASTRGDRKVDHILAGKAVFKNATNTAGDAAIVAGAATAMTSRSDTQSLAGLGLVVGGIITKVVSSATHPEADIRAWDNLPHSLFLTGLKVPVGEISKIKIEGRDGTDAVISTALKEVNLGDGTQKRYIWVKLP